MIRCCTPCGRIWAPRVAPSRCPECDLALTSASVRKALALGQARQDRLRASARAARGPRPADRFTRPAAVRREAGNDDALAGEIADVLCVLAGQETPDTIAAVLARARARETTPAEVLRIAQASPETFETDRGRHLRLHAAARLRRADPLDRDLLAISAVDELEAQSRRVEAATALLHLDDPRQHPSAVRLIVGTLLVDPASANAVPLDTARALTQLLLRRLSPDPMTGWRTAAAVIRRLVAAGRHADAEHVLVLTPEFGLPAVASVERLLLKAEVVGEGEGGGTAADACRLEAFRRADVLVQRHGASDDAARGADLDQGKRFRRLRAEAARSLTRSAEPDAVAVSFAAYGGPDPVATLPAHDLLPRVRQALRDGRLRDAAEASIALVEAPRAGSPPDDVLTGLDVLDLLGRRTDAVALARGLEDAFERRWPAHRAAFGALRSRLELSSGHLDVAEDLVREAEALAPGGDGRSSARIACARADLALARGDALDAERALLGVRWPGPADLAAHELRALRGRVAAALGHPRAAAFELRCALGLRSTENAPYLGHWLAGHRGLAELVWLHHLRGDARVAVALAARDAWLAGLQDQSESDTPVLAARTKLAQALTVDTISPAAQEQRCSLLEDAAALVLRDPGAVLDRLTIDVELARHRPVALRTPVLQAASQQAAALGAWGPALLLAEHEPSAAPLGGLTATQRALLTHLSLGMTCGRTAGRLGWRYERFARCLQAALQRLDPDRDGAPAPAPGERVPSLGRQLAAHDARMARRLAENRQGPALRAPDAPQPWSRAS